MPFSACRQSSKAKRYGKKIRTLQALLPSYPGLQPVSAVGIATTSHQGQKLCARAGLVSPQPSTAMLLPPNAKIRESPSYPKRDQRNSKAQAISRRENESACLSTVIASE